MSEKGLAKFGGGSSRFWDAERVSHLTYLSVNEGDHINFEQQATAQCKVNYHVVYQWWDLNSQPLSYKPSALAIELHSSKGIAGKELSLSSWCIASLYVYHFSYVVDFLSEKYSGSTGLRNSWYQ